MVLTLSTFAIQKQNECQMIIKYASLCTGCVSESGDFKNVLNSKCFHLFCFNTYEHNVYIKAFRFFTFNALKTKVLLPENNIIQMTTIPLYALGKSLANVTHYSLKHVHRNCLDFLPNSMFQLLNCVGCWSFEDLRFQIPPEKEITC